MKKTFSYIFMLFFLCGTLELQANQHATDIAVVNRYKKTLLNKQDRTSLIQYLIKKNNYTSYLEIGVSNGEDRKSTRLNSSHMRKSRMPSSA